jgi:predicted O-linked N-acetylglucosamine transferase (SPINDLY family)
MPAKPTTDPPQDLTRALMRDAQRALASGNPHQAGAVARRLAKLSPRDPDALNACAWIAHQAGDKRAAARFLEQSLALDPNRLEALSNLATLYHADGRYADACGLLERAIASAASPDAVPAGLHYNYGNALKALGRLDAAEQAFRVAIARQPDMPAFHGNLANTLVALGRQEAAVDAYRHSLALRPDHAETLRQLAATLRKLRRFDEAAATLRDLLALDAGGAETHAAHGALLRDQGQSAAAIDAYRRAIALDPGLAAAHLDLGALLLQASSLTEATGCFETTIALEPTSAEAHNNLGTALTQQGRYGEAFAALERAFALAPHNPDAEAALLFAAQYLPDLAPAELTRRHVAWAQHHMDRLARPSTYPNVPVPTRRLRVGYVSPDFRWHAVGDFLMPVLQHHDRTQVEVFCYAEVAHPDGHTEAFRALADGWRPTIGRTDTQVAAQIREDAIDILVELSGHTANHRLGVLARKPAPIQLSWLGYPCTTGLATIDYRLSDAIADPAPEADALHRERVIRLPHGFLVYVPPRPAPEVGPPPAATEGAVTFGSFNNLAKLNDRVVAVWANILDSVPGSRLLLKSHQLADTGTAELVRARFIAAGIAAERMLLEPGMREWTRHMARYGTVDIGLDPFPYNGTTTTCEALWMGVPVITLLGDRHAARVGASLLTRLGLTELIATDIDDYVAKAAALAADPARLAGLRAGLRPRFAASALGDPVRFARDVEAAYREIWADWCAAQAPTPNQS